MAVYKSPVDENGKPYYVPVVVKNKDSLVGYIKGLDYGREVITDVMDSMGIAVTLPRLDVMLDSNRYNDILKNGKHESEMSESDMKEYLLDLLEEISAKLDSGSEQGVFDEDILHIECLCGLGIYSWNDYNLIPEKTFKCTECGKVLIHYTGINEYELEYEGDKHA